MYVCMYLYMSRIHHKQRRDTPVCLEKSGKGCMYVCMYDMHVCLLMLVKHPGLPLGSEGVEEEEEE